MRTRSFALVAAVLALLFVSAGAVYAFDKSKEGMIADGVTVSGVDVGGLDRAAARAKLEAALLDPLRRPVRVKYKDRRFRLTPTQASVGIDLDGSVDRALARSRTGNLFTRSLREVTNERLVADVPVDVNYDKAAIRRLVARIAKEIDTKPEEADVSFAGGRIETKASKDGRRVRTGVLRRDLDETLLSLEGTRTVRVRTKTVKPKVTTERVAEKYPAILMVDRANFKLTLYKDLKPAKSYGIAVGKVGLDTPAGLYNIQNKAIDPAWTVPDSDWAGDLRGKVIPGGVPENPLKARWLGIYNGVGIHGTGDPGSIGSNASHGCIRMRINEVKELYDEVPVGAPIYIA